MNRKAGKNAGGPGAGEKTLRPRGARKPVVVPSFRLYRTAAAEEEAAQHDADEARARWIAFAEAIEAGQAIDFIPDRIAVGSALRERAERAGVVPKKRQRGNPQFIDNAIYDRTRAAVDVALLVRRHAMKPEDAADEVARNLGRTDGTAVMRCYRELRVAAEAYVDLLFEVERKGVARFIE